MGSLPFFLLPRLSSLLLCAFHIHHSGEHWQREGIYTYGFWPFSYFLWVFLSQKCLHCSVKWLHSSSNISVLIYIIKRHKVKVLKSFIRNGSALMISKTTPSGEEQNSSCKKINANWIVIVTCDFRASEEAVLIKKLWESHEGTGLPLLPITRRNSLYHQNKKVPKITVLYDPLASYCV